MTRNWGCVFILLCLCSTVSVKGQFGGFPSFFGSQGSQGTPSYFGTPSNQGISSPTTSPTTTTPPPTTTPTATGTPTTPSNQGSITPSFNRDDFFSQFSNGGLGGFGQNPDQDEEEVPEGTTPGGPGTTDDSTNTPEDESTTPENENDDDKEDEKDKDKKPSLPINHNNVILIIADDLGIEFIDTYRDQMRGQGRSTYPYTPNINRLASQGVRFNRAYSYPSCSPTRASMLTGRFGFRNGVRYAVGMVCERGLQLPQPTIPNSIPSNAVSACIGKWHLSDQSGFTAIYGNVKEAGFDLYEGILEGRIAGPSYEFWEKTLDNGEQVTEPTYATTYLTDRALQWIEENKEKPFFLWLAHVAPHVPFHRPPSNLITNDPGPYTRSSDPVPFAQAALEALDTEIGRFLDSIDEEILKKTTIIFLGDNGSDFEYADFKPWGPDEAKGTVSEGGVRIPFIISGSGVIAKGSVSESLVSTVDIFSTVVEIMGGRQNVNMPIDSISLVPLMKSPNAGRRQFAFTEQIGDGKTCDNPPMFVFTYGDAYIGNTYKLITPFEYAADGVTQVPLPKRMYNLVEDPFEDNDLLADGEESLGPIEKAAFRDMQNKREELLNS